MRSLTILGLIAVIGGCTDQSLATRRTPQATLIAAAPATPSPKPSPTPPPTPTPYPTIGPLPSDLDPYIRDAIEQRRTYRLRFDLDYVLKVEADPAAYDLIGFKMYEEEGERLSRDMAEQDGIIGTAQAYWGAGPDVWAGIYIDREDMPGVVVALFTRDAAAHEAAIREWVGPTELFATRQVKYSEVELRGIQDRISQDMDAPWVRKIPAIIHGVGVRISENVIRISVSSANPDAAAIIASRYGLGDRIVVESDGTGVMLVPWGNVKGTVTLPGGKPFKVPPSLPVMLTSDGPGDSLGTCNGSDVGYGVDTDGRFEYPCQIGRRTIYIQVPTEEDGMWRTIGQGTVVVEEGRTARLDIELDERP